MKVLQVLVALNLGKESAYVHSVIAQVLIVLYQHKKQLPQWRMMLDNLGVFDEEAGEIGFGILARCVVGDTRASKFEHLNDMYCLVHEYMEVDAEVRACATGTLAKDSWRKTFKVDSPEVVGAASFLRLLTRRLAHGDAKVYDGSPSGWTSLQKGQSHQVNRGSRERMWVATTIAARVMTSLNRAKLKYISTSFGYQMRAVWPEFDDYDFGSDISEATVEYTTTDAGETDASSDEHPQIDEVEHKHDLVVQTPGKKVDYPATGSDDSDAERPGARDSTRKRRRSKLTSSPKSTPLKPIHREYCRVGEANITHKSHRERPGRAERKNDADFPMTQDY